MSVLIPNDFASYSLTDDESIEGSTFTITQKQVLQNYLSEFSMEKLAIEFDPDDPKKFMQAESYKRGQIDVLKYLLATSDATEEEVRYRASSGSL